MRGIKSNEKTFFRRVIHAAAAVLEQLGKQAFQWALEHSVVSQIEGGIDDWKAMPETELAAKGMEELEKFRDGIADAMAHVKQRLWEDHTAGRGSDLGDRLHGSLAETAVLYGAEQNWDNFNGYASVLTVHLYIQWVLC